VPPLDVYGLTNNVSDISAGHTHVCALTAQGGVKCWGRNGDGQLGDGTTRSSAVPVDVVGLGSSIIKVSPGLDHTCALTATGAVKCWGNGWIGQLGDGVNHVSPTPVDMVGLSGGVTDITAGEDDACALVDGGVKCWGFNFYGELGNQSSQNSTVPVDVFELNTGVLSIASGEFYNCAVTNAGAKCWGAGWAGQLGDGTTNGYWQPVDVSGLGGGILALSACSINTCALMAGGGVKCWGENGFRQVAGNPNASELVPVDLTRLSGAVTRIAARNFSICAVANGGAKCWGWNGDYMLGSGPVYLNILAATDSQGQVTFNLQPGAYTFRVEFPDEEFLASCSVPGCSSAEIEIVYGG
jgi:alpha-tubulin suppressor-like RCC1 family protein